MTRLLTLAAVLTLAPTAAGQTTYTLPVSTPLPTTSAAYAGLYAVDGGMLEVRALGADVVLIAHGAPVAARLAALAPTDAATDARTVSLLDAWTLGDLAPLVAAARPSQRVAMGQTLADYHAALVRGRGALVAGSVIGTFTQIDGRRATLVQMVFERGSEFATFVWDEADALVAVRRGLPPVHIGIARAVGGDAFTTPGTPVTFDRESDGGVYAVHVGERFTAVR
ncbi:hypothetical protein [Rubrivirga sp. IMCC45206]|uniref:hypothetical protein n=1 Tax=Rubrivirga sp. IMCC45206 TaxID=3391614 RepID=UPI00398FEE0E